MQHCGTRELRQRCVARVELGTRITIIQSVFSGVALFGVASDVHSTSSNAMHEPMSEQPPLIAFSSAVADRVESMDANLGHEIVALPSEQIQIVEADR